MSRHVLIYKLKAALVSLSVFLTFAVALAVITYHFWYPDYLFWLDGGIQGLRLVYAVDIVLGPLLALVFFHPEKSRGKLFFDVVFIAVIQFSAMAWGCYQIYSQRPVAVVYGSGRFISVAPQIMALQQKSADDLRQYSEDRPPHVFRREPVGDDEQRRKLSMLMRHGFHFESQAWLFTPFREHLPEVFRWQKAFHDYIEDSLVEPWTSWAAGRSMADYRFAFYEGRYANALLMFSEEGRYEGYIRLGDPFIPDLAAKDDEEGAASAEKAH